MPATDPVTIAIEILLNALALTGDHTRAANEAIDVAKKLPSGPTSEEIQRHVAELGRSMDRNARRMKR